MPPLPADSIHARACKLKCEKILTRPQVELAADIIENLQSALESFRELQAQLAK